MRVGAVAEKVSKQPIYRLAETLYDKLPKDDRELDLRYCQEKGQRGPGTISEFDSGGCLQLSPNAWARACSGCGALFGVLGKRNWCIQNRKSFPEIISVLESPNTSHRQLKVRL